MDLSQEFKINICFGLIILFFPIKIVGWSWFYKSKVTGLHDWNGFKLKILMSLASDIKIKNKTVSLLKI